MSDPAQLPASSILLSAPALRLLPFWFLAALAPLVSSDAASNLLLGLFNTPSCSVKDAFGWTSEHSRMWLNLHASSLHPWQKTEFH